MVSEDLEKIPLLLFFFVIVIYIDATYIIQFYHTRTFTDALIAVSLAIVSAVFFLVLRALIKWIRR